MKSCNNLSPFLNSIYFTLIHCLQSACQPLTSPQNDWLEGIRFGDISYLLSYWIGYSMAVTAHLIKTVKKLQTWKNLDRHPIILSLYRGENRRLGDLFTVRKFSVKELRLKSRFLNSQSETHADSLIQTLVEELASNLLTISQYLCWKILL